jgi:hypothetical protein
LILLICETLITTIFIYGHGDEKTALKFAQKAILSEERVVKYRRKATRSIENKIPEEIKPYIGTIGTIGISAIRGKIETKKLNNFDFNALGGKIIPSVEYDFKEDTIDANIFYKVDF